MGECLAAGSEFDVRADVVASFCAALALFAGEADFEGDLVAYAEV